MSAAEQAHHGPDHAVSAPVIPIRTATRPPRRHPRRESPTVVPHRDLTEHEQLAATLEALFAKHGRSLSDDETVQDFLITLSAVRSMLQGALTRGSLDERAHGELDAMVEGMMAAPGLLA